MRTVRLNAADNVEILVEAGQLSSAEGRKVPVQPGHKIASADIAAGAAVIKYGHLIGHATSAIKAGDHVHTHNLASIDETGDLRLARQHLPAVHVAPLGEQHFMGYKRSDGSFGTRNYIAICATVNCSATVVHRAAAALNALPVIRDNPDIDGVFAVAHNTGCGMAATGAGADILERVLWGYATHPNVAAAVFIGLGCEVMQVAKLRKRYPKAAEERIHMLTIQETGGTSKTVQAVVDRVASLANELVVRGRESAPLSALKIGLQCGGSDAFSGITANPALGVASDRLAALGASPVLSETPEIYGAEDLLLARAEDTQIADQLKAKLKWWHDYTQAHGAALNNNPSPGNKAGGLTTILEKSLGAVAKAGHAPLRAVIDYAEQITRPGLNFMDTPGYDPVSVTGQIAGGCQIICFTTGRGSAFGSKPAPTIKLASNDAIFSQMRDDMDIGCGDILAKSASIESKGEEIFEAILQTASGRKTKSEELGLGDHEFIPWNIGAVL